MARIAVNGININYHEAGAGVPIVLIHGLSDSSALWSAMIPKLATRYRTIALDLRGHGESEKPDMPYSIQLFSEDLLSFLQKLKILSSHVLGLSLGAAVAQQLALDHQERIRSLILLSPFSYNNSDLRENLNMLQERVISGGLPAFFDAAIRLAVTPEFISANADTIPQMKKECVRINSRAAILHAIDACMNFDVRDRTSQISQHVLVISGKEDVLTPIHLAEQIHLSIKSSEWKVMEGVGHNLLVPHKVPELAEIILEFLQHQ
jgi:3-oxoadipate enol-lactonase